MNNTPAAIPQRCFHRLRFHPVKYNNIKIQSQSIRLGSQLSWAAERHTWLWSSRGEAHQTPERPGPRSESPTRSDARTPTCAERTKTKPVTFSLLWSNSLRLNHVQGNHNCDIAKKLKHKCQCHDDISHYYDLVWNEKTNLATFSLNWSKQPQKSCLLKFIIMT